MKRFLQKTQEISANPGAKVSGKIWWVSVQPLHLQSQLCRIAVKLQVQQIPTVAKSWDIRHLVPEDLSGNALGIEAAEVWGDVSSREVMPA